MNNFLKYGDLIIFYGQGISEEAQGNDNNPKDRKNDTRGALSALGLTDTGIYY